MPIQSAIYAKAFQMAPHLDVDGVAPLLRYVEMTEQSCKSLNCLVREAEVTSFPKKVEDFHAQNGAL